MDPPASPSRRNRRSLEQVLWQLGDAHSNWAPVVANQAKQLLDRREADALWTTSGPFSHLHVGAKLARRHGVAWVADLRDPVSTDVTAPDGWLGGLLRARRTLYRHSLLEADAITTAIHHVVEADGPWLGREPMIVPPGFDSEQWAEARLQASPAEDRFDIVYAGKLYEEHQRLDVFLRALRLVADGLAPEERRRLRFVYYGRSGSFLREMARRHGCGELVEDRGFVEPDSVPHRIASASVLLLLTIERGGGVPGGKLYEYLGAHRPILAVPGGGRHVRSVLSETNAGAAAEEHQQVAEELRNWFSRWRVDRKLAFEGDAGRIESFSARESARVLAALLNQLTSGPREADRRTARRRTRQRMCDEVQRSNGDVRRPPSPLSVPSTRL